MEAFNRFSVSKRPLRTPARSFKEQEKSGSFLERMELKRTADEAMIDPEAVLKEPKHSKQDLDLRKLVLQPNKDHLVIRTINPSLIPNNNPFKIRKTDEINMESAEYGLQQLEVSSGTKSEGMDVSCSSPNSKDHDCSEDKKEVIIDLSKLVDGDSEKNREEEGFESTEDDIVEIQDHVNITTKRVRGAKPRTESFKVKTSSTGSENKKAKINKKSSILDFFHRL